MKTSKFVFLITIILLILNALLFIVENNISFFATILFIFSINFASTIGLNSPPGYILFRKTEFKVKKFIIFDFESYPNIPIWLLYHQLLSYIYLLLGIVSFFTLYLLSIYSKFSWDWERLLYTFSLIYGYGVGGFIALFFLVIQIYEFTKYRGEFYVDSKIIK